MKKLFFAVLFIVSLSMYGQDITVVDGVAYKNYTTTQLNAISVKKDGDTYFDKTKGSLVYWWNGSWATPSGGLAPGDQAKLDFIAVTQAVDLDNIETKANSAVQTEADPVFTAWDKDYADLINTPSPLTVVNNLTSTSTTQPLSAAMGNYLQNTKLGTSGGIISGNIGYTNASSITMNGGEFKGASRVDVTYPGGYTMISNFTDINNYNLGYVDGKKMTFNIPNNKWYINGSEILDRSYLLDEDNMASNSATKVPSQQSVKAYVDATSDGNPSTNGQVLSSTTSGTRSWVSALTKDNILTGNTASVGFSATDGPKVTMSPTAKTATLQGGSTSESSLSSVVAGANNIGFNFDGASYTLNSSGTPSAGTDLIDKAFADANYTGGGGGTVTSVNGATGVVTLDAGDIGITDSGTYFTGTDVETALQELGASTVTVVDNLTTASSTSALSAGKGKDLQDNKAEKSNVLELDNTDAFTPTLDYHPATKKYVDDVVVTGASLTADQTFTGLNTFSDRLTGKYVLGVEGFTEGPAYGTLGKRWMFGRELESTDDFKFRYETVSNTGGAGSATVLYKLNYTGVPSDVNDVVTKGYADANYLGGGSPAASSVSVADGGGYFTGTNVETVLQEVGYAIGAGVSPEMSERIANQGTYLFTTKSGNETLTSAIVKPDTSPDRGKKSWRTYTTNLAEVTVPGDLPVGWSSVIEAGSATDSILIKADTGVDIYGQGNSFVQSGTGIDGLWLKKGRSVALIYKGANSVRAEGPWNVAAITSPEQYTTANALSINNEANSSTGVTKQGTGSGAISIQSGGNGSAYFIRLTTGGSGASSERAEITWTVPSVGNYTFKVDVKIDGSSGYLDQWTNVTKIGGGTADPQDGGAPDNFTNTTWTTKTYNLYCSSTTGIIRVYGADGTPVKLVDIDNVSITPYP